jgi:hypothetical protein
VDSFFKLCIIILLLTHSCYSMQVYLVRKMLTRVERILPTLLTQVVQVQAQVIQLQETLVNFTTHCSSSGTLSSFIVVLLAISCILLM